MAQSILSTFPSLTEAPLKLRTGSHKDCDNSSVMSEYTSARSHESLRKGEAGCCTKAGWGPCNPSGVPCHPLCEVLVD